jgi:hypothetical protein
LRVLGDGEELLVREPRGSLGTSIDFLIGYCFIKYL